MSLLALPADVVCYALSREPRAIIAIRSVSRACCELSGEAAKVLLMFSSNAAVRAQLLHGQDPVPALTHIQRAVRLEHAWRVRLKHRHGAAMSGRTRSELLHNAAFHDLRCSWCDIESRFGPQLHLHTIEAAALWHFLALASLGTGSDWQELQVETVRCLCRREGIGFASRAIEAGGVALIIALLRRYSFKPLNSTLLVLSFDAISRVLQTGFPTLDGPSSPDRTMDRGVCEAAVAAMLANPTKRCVINCVCDLLHTLCDSDATGERSLQVARSGAIEACCESMMRGRVVEDAVEMGETAAFPFLASVAHYCPEARSRAAEAGAIKLLVEALSHADVDETRLPSEIFRALGNIIASDPCHRQRGLQVKAERKIIDRLSNYFKYVDWSTVNEDRSFRPNAEYALRMLGSEVQVAPSSVLPVCTHFGSDWWNGAGGGADDTGVESGGTRKRRGRKTHEQSWRERYMAAKRTTAAREHSDSEIGNGCAPAGTSCECGDGADADDV